MVLNLFGSKTTKGQILKLLSEEWPLTAKQIHNSIQRKYASTTSYQACHKALKEMQEDGVLSKENNDYKLNQEWIEKTKDFSENLHKKYAEKQTENPTITLPNLYEVDKFLLQILLQNLPEKGEKPFLGLQWCHFWIPLFLSVKEYKLMKEHFPKFELYAVCRGNTIIDKWCAQFWKTHTVKEKTGVECSSTADLVIFNDTVIEVFYSQEIRKELDKFFGKAKKIQDLDTNYLFENVFHKKTEINIVIHKNQKLANQLKEQTINYFKKAIK